MKKVRGIRNTCVDCIFGEYIEKNEQIYCHIADGIVDLTKCGDYIKATSVDEIVSAFFKRRSDEHLDDIISYYKS